MNDFEKGLKKGFGVKTYNMPQAHKDAIGKGGMYEHMGLDGKVQNVDIKKIMDDNDLHNDEVLNYRNRPKTWDNELEKKIGISDFIYGNMDENGKIILGDGRHRVRALYNSGYDEIEMPVGKKNE